MVNCIENRRRSSMWAITFADPRRWNTLMMGVIVLGIVWILASHVPAPVAGASAPPSPQIGFAAPDFTLDTLDGETITLSELRGKPGLINLWASWCPPCRAEMPALDEVYRQYRDDGFVVLAVNTTYQDSEEGARDFAGAYSLSFPILLDRDGAVSQRYRLQALPTTFFVGRDSIIRDIVIGGPMNEALIATKVEGLLAEEGP